MRKTIMLFLIFALSFAMGCAVRTIKPADERKAVQEKPSVEDFYTLYEDGWDAAIFNRGDYNSFIKKMRSGDLKSISFRKLPGYFLKTPVALPKDINFFTVNSEKKLNELMGRSHLRTELYRHDMSKTFITIIALRPSTSAFTINISSAYLEGSQVYIVYGIKPMDNIGVRYFRKDIAVFETARPRTVTTVHFIDESGKGIAIPYGRRLESSPKNIVDMRKNFTGRYRGTLSSLTSSGMLVVTELILSPDYTFVLKQSYKGDSERVFEMIGKWAPTEDLASIVLNYDKSDRDQRKFLFINNKEIEQLNFNGDRLEEGNNLLRKN